MQKNDRQPELGLVCVTDSQAVKYRTLTRKRLLQMNTQEQEAYLHSLYADNIKRLEKALDFCLANQIRLYRLKSDIFPFSDIPLGETLLQTFAAQLKQIGDRAIQLGIRLVLHPPQFVVLNSDTPATIENSITVLKAHARLMDYLGQPHSPWAALNIHGGKSNRADRLIETIRALPWQIRSRLTLENDEYAYGAEAILKVCLKAEVAMVFDAHHHVIHEHLSSYEHESVARLLAAARSTWQIPDHQLVHISNGRNQFSDPQHSDYIETMPSSYRYAPWIEVEAKKKELAINKLQQEWLAQIALVS